MEYLDLFFLKKHYWFASYDGADLAGREIRLRALIDGRGAGSIAIKNAIIAALKNKQDRQIGGASFSRILVMHLIASMYLEGLLSEKRTAATCVMYPGHSVTSTPPPLIEAALDGLKFVRMSIKHDVLNRWSDAVHSSQSRHAQQHAKVLFSNQPSTVFIPKTYKSKGKRVFVVDDFTTDGFSLENARNMLLEDGAERVTMIAFGKYPKPHTVAVPRPAGVLRPHVQQRYTDANFRLGAVGVPEDAAALTEFIDLVGKIAGSSIGPKLLT